jgi:hypothetical protein
MQNNVSNDSTAKSENHGTISTGAFHLNSFWKNISILDQAIS